MLCSAVPALGPQQMIMTSHDRSSADRSFDGRSPHRRLWSDRFVGRERQLERIAVGLQSAADGKPNAIVLSGTAGLGLTRLLGETRRRIEALAEPFAAVHGVALPATSGVPYAPVTAALERLLAPLPDETLAELVGPTGDAIARLVPSLRPRLEELQLLPDRPRIAATEWREARMFEAVLGLAREAWRAAAGCLAAGGPPPRRCGYSRTGHFPGSGDARSAGPACQSPTSPTGCSGRIR